MTPKVIQLYQQMYEHTKGECSTNCQLPQSCCDELYCDMADAYAKERGVTLDKTNHPRLQFMSENGCTVPPHLRPLCTLHTCAINSLGFKRDDMPWTKKYFQIRNAIEKEENKK